MDKVIISDTPHIRSVRTTKSIMLDVVIALLPACLAGCAFFGLRALLVLALSTFSAVAAEFVYKFCQKKDFFTILREFDFTSVITGLLIGMCMSSEVEWYVPVISSIFAIVFVKMIFGGTGKNIVNPAIIGRIFAFMSFTVSMATFDNLGGGYVSSGATVLTSILTDGLNSSTATNLQLLAGIRVDGCIGETCKLALLVGGIYLVIRGVIDWRWPTIYIVSCALMTCALYQDMGYFFPSIFSGGLFLGAIFMSTDYVTSPNNKYACYAYYLALGILTAGLRKATQMEVVSFAILIMNLLVPIFNYIRPRPFGSTPIRQLIAEKFANLKNKKKEDK